MANINSPQSHINIHPGDWYFGAEHSTIYTVVGSCVSVIAWHPIIKIGGLCHFILPGSAQDSQFRRNKHDNYSGHYAQDALLLMEKAMLKYGSIYEYQISVFGGSSPLNHYNIGNQNILAAQEWLKNKNTSAHIFDTGGNISRSITLNILTGNIIVKHYAMDA